MHSTTTRTGQRMLVAAVAALGLLGAGLVGSPASATSPASSPASSPATSPATSPAAAVVKKAKPKPVTVGTVRIVDVTSETNLVTVASAVKVNSPRRKVKKVKIEYTDTTSGAVKTVQAALYKGSRRHGTFRGRVSFGAGQVRALRATKVRVIGYGGRKLKTASVPSTTAPAMGVYSSSFSYVITSRASGPASDRVMRTSVEYSNATYNGTLRFHPTLRNSSGDVVSHADVPFTNGVAARNFDASPGRRLVAFRLTSTGTDTGGLFWQF